jgi:hypothetical protein
MTLFLRRFFGALMLDASAFEDVENDRTALVQSLIVIAMSAAAGGVAAIGLGLTGATGFAIGAALVLGAWLVWIFVVSVIGTIALREPHTHSDVVELIRTLGFATAPGVFVAFAAMRAVAPFVLTLVLIWMIADAVVAMRQALDYRSTARAVAVIAIAWLLTFGIVAAIAIMFSKPVS